MSTDAVNEPVRHTHDDVLGRLAAIDHRLDQISTHLATIGKLVSQLEEIRANLDTLIGSLSSGQPIVSDAACQLPGRGRRTT